VWATCKTLSDFPDFARHIASLTALWKSTERFWTGGVFLDDLGLTVNGGFAKLYQLPDQIAVMMANLIDRPSSVAFELDALRHAIDDTPFSLVSSSGQTSSGKVQSIDGKLRGSIALSGYDVMAAIFSTHRQNTSGALHCLFLNAAAIKAACDRCSITCRLRLSRSDAFRHADSCRANRTALCSHAASRLLHL
jgi:hypothetical protein